jgi:hypothetical protein
MLRIEEAQFEAFRHAAVSRANDLLASYARQRFPYALRQVSEMELLAMVSSVRTRAAARDIKRECDLRFLIDVTLARGEDIFGATWAADLLDTTRLTGNEKVRALRERTHDSTVHIVSARA